MKASVCRKVFQTLLDEVEFIENKSKPTSKLKVLGKNLFKKIKNVNF